MSGVPNKHGLATDPEISAAGRKTPVNSPDWQGINGYPHSLFRLHTRIWNKSQRSRKGTIPVVQIQHENSVLRPPQLPDWTDRFTSKEVNDRVLHEFRVGQTDYNIFHVASAGFVKHLHTLDGMDRLGKKKIRAVLFFSLPNLCFPSRMLCCASGRQGFFVALFCFLRKGRNRTALLSTSQTIAIACLVDSNAWKIRVPSRKKEAPPPNSTPPLHFFLPYGFICVRVQYFWGVYYYMRGLQVMYEKVNKKVH